MKVYDHFVDLWKTLKLMHMKKYLFYLSMALVAVVLFSCKSGKKSVFTPTSSGRAYEVPRCG